MLCISYFPNVHMFKIPQTRLQPSLTGGPLTPRHLELQDSQSARPWAGLCVLFLGSFLSVPPA